MSRLIRLSQATALPEITRPAPDRVLQGDPVHTTWNAEDRDGLYCGLWQSTPGKWRVAYTEWEYCHILQGISILTEDGEQPQTVRVGDSLILRPGLTGTWEVVETTLKDYVIRL